MTTAPICARGVKGPPASTTFWPHGAHKDDYAPVDPGLTRGRAGEMQGNVIGPDRAGAVHGDRVDGAVCLYRVPDAMAMLSLGRSVIYEQIRAGRLKSVTQGRTRLIPAAAIADYIALLLREADRGDPS